MYGPFLLARLSCARRIGFAKRFAFRERGAAGTVITGTALYRAVSGPLRSVGRKRRVVHAA